MNPPYSTPGLVGRRRGEGTTLVETVFAATLLALVALAMAVSLINGLIASEYAGELDRAREAARSKVDEITAWEDFLTIRSRFDGSTFPVSGLTSARSPGGDPGLVRVVEMGVGLVDVAVTVDWVGAHGDQSISFRTCVADSRPR